LRFHLLLILSVVLVVISGCGLKQNIQIKDNIQLTISPSIPKAGEFSSFLVNTRDETFEKIEILLNMEEMDHLITGTMKLAGKNKYTLDLPTAMAGKWYAEVFLYRGNEVVKTVRFLFEAEGELSEKYLQGYNADKK
jgi:hypothetical protein